MLTKHVGLTAIMMICAVFLQGCELIGNIFGAGVYTGIILVVIIVAIIIFAIVKIKKS
jgi:hypothetical protein